jgi:hypothetical protein
MTPLLNPVEEAQGDLVQEVVDRLVMVLVKEGGSILQLVQDGIGEAQAQGDPISQPMGSFPQGGMEILPNRPQIGDPEERHPLPSGHFLKDFTVLLRGILPGH